MKLPWNHLLANYMFINLTVCQQTTNVKLNCCYYIEIFETIQVCADKWALGCLKIFPTNIWTLTKRPKKKLDGNYTRMLRAILNKSWRQHPTRHQLYGHLPPITKTIQVRRTRHAGHCWRSRDELISDELLWPSKSRTTSSKIHTAAMWGYGM